MGLLMARQGQVPTTGWPISTSHPKRRHLLRDTPLLSMKAIDYGKEWLIHKLVSCGAKTTFNLPLPWGTAVLAHRSLGPGPKDKLI